MRLGGAMSPAPRSGAMTPFPIAGVTAAQPFGQRPMDIRTFDAGISQVVPRTPSSPTTQTQQAQAPQRQSPMLPPPNQGPQNLQQSMLSVSQFGQLPAAFQQRFQERQASGLNQGFSEQDAVNYYNQNYLSRGRGLQPDAGMTAYGPGAQRPIAMTPEVAPALAPRFQGMSLADQLERQRLTGQGIYGGPTQQERAQFNADVQGRIQSNPSPINQFLEQELMGRTAEGRAMNLRDLQLGYLSRPMQGGMLRGSSAEMDLAREQRLSMLSAMNPPAERGPVPMTTVIGPEQPSDRRELRLAGLPARREADRLAVANRLDRMRHGRLAMRANQQAAERQAFEMATNPLVNPMLLRGNPAAMAEAMRLGQQQREFEAEAPVRQARTIREALETEGLRLQNEASERMLSPEAQAQQRMENARNRLDQIVPNLTPEAIAAMPPEMRQYIGSLQKEAMGIADGGQVGVTVATPSTIPEAESTVSSITPTVQSILQEDPSAMTAVEIESKIAELEKSGSILSPADKQSIQNYITSRSMYDVPFANRKPGNLSVLWDAFKGMFPTFPGTVPGSPTPPQFTYPRMGPG